MKKVIVLLAILTTPVFGEFYRLTITRIDNNLYKSSDGFYIETSYCYEYAYNEDVVLSYEDYSYDNKIIFSNNNTCDIKRVFK